MPAVTLAIDTSAEGRLRRQRNLAAVESFFAFMHAKDIDSWIDLWADDGRILVPYPPQGAGFPPSIAGRDQILAGFQPLFAHFTSFDADVHTIYPSIDPDIVIVEWSVEAHLDTGAVYRGDNITVFRFRDGKISHYHDYFNPELFRTVVQATSADAGTPPHIDLGAAPVATPGDAARAAAAAVLSTAPPPATAWWRGCARPRALR